MNTVCCLCTGPHHARHCPQAGYARRLLSMRPPIPGLHPLVVAVMREDNRTTDTRNAA